MRRRIVLDPLVATDLHEIVSYLNERTTSAADRFVDAVFSSLDDLAEMPGKGSLKTFRRTRLRDVRTWWVMGFRKYLIFYEVMADAIVVIAVTHGARNVRRLIKERKR